MNTVGRKLADFGGRGFERGFRGNRGFEGGFDGGRGFFRDRGFGFGGGGSAAAASASAAASRGGFCMSPQPAMQLYACAWLHVHLAVS